MKAELTGIIGPFKAIFGVFKGYLRAFSGHLFAFFEVTFCRLLEALSAATNVCQEVTTGWFQP
jgi:hypothetical protein